MGEYAKNLQTLAENAAPRGNRGEEEGRRKMKYRIKGINDEHDTCDLCGKAGLKRVVWLAPLDRDGQETADPSPYGVCCAAELLRLPWGAKKNRDYIESKHRQCLVERWTDHRKRLIEDGTLKVWSGIFLPLDIRVAYCKGEISFDDQIKLRNKRYPMFDITGYELTETIEKALETSLKH